MAINLDDVGKQDSEAKGNLTNTTTFTGDISGQTINASGLTVTGIQTHAVVSTTPTLEQAYVWNEAGTNLTPQRVVLFNKELSANPATSRIEGSYDSGLSLFNIYNGAINKGGTPPSFTAEGEGLVYDGADFLDVRPLNLRREQYLTAATFQANNRDKIFCDSTANAIAITPPASPANGFYFEVFFVVKGGSNNVTISLPTPLDLTAVSAVIVMFTSGGWITQNIGSPSP